MSTQNVNVARFARNVEWDFFCDFQTPCAHDDPWGETADSTTLDTHFSSTEEKFSFKPLDNRCRPKDYRSPGAWAKTFDFAYFIRCKVFENLWKKSLFNFFWNFEKKKFQKLSDFPFSKKNVWIFALKINGILAVFGAKLKYFYRQKLLLFY